MGFLHSERQRQLAVEGIRYCLRWRQFGLPGCLRLLTVTSAEALTVSELIQEGDHNGETQQVVEIRLFHGWDCVAYIQGFRHH